MTEIENSKLRINGFEGKPSIFRARMFCLDSVNSHNLVDYLIDFV